MNSSLYSSSNMNSQRFAEGAAFVTGLIGYPIICIIGILGNGICIFVFNHQKMRNSTNVYLTALAVSDIVKLINDFMYFPTVLLKSQILYAVYYPYGFFISQYFATVSAWLTVSVAFERLLMVVYPGCSRGLLTITKARLESFLVYFILFIVNIPCGMRYKTVCRFPDGNYTSVCNDNITSTQLDVEPTDLWQNVLFRKIYSSFQGSMRSIIPVVILIGLNAQIIVSLHQTRANKKMNARNRVTFLLIIVVGCFIGLAAPDAIMSLMGWGYHDAESNLRKGLREITDMLLALNSAVNFFLYVIFNSVFRENFLQLCRICGCCVKPSQAGITTTSLTRRENGHSPNINRAKDNNTECSRINTTILSVNRKLQPSTINILGGIETTLEPLLLKPVGTTGDIDDRDENKFELQSFIVHSSDTNDNSYIKPQNSLENSSASLLSLGVMVTDI